MVTTFEEVPTHMQLAVNHFLDTTNKSLQVFLSVIVVLVIIIFLLLLFF